MEQPNYESDGLGERKLMLALLWCTVHSASLGAHDSSKRVTTTRFSLKGVLLDLALRGCGFSSFVMIKGAFGVAGSV